MKKQVLQRPPLGVYRKALPGFCPGCLGFRSFRVHSMVECGSRDEVDFPLRSPPFFSVLHEIKVGEGIRPPKRIKTPGIISPPSPIILKKHTDTGH